MAQHHKISIVTPSLNQGTFIEATIQSVLDQGYPGLEYIVVDGGSTDTTISILKKYERHLTWISEPDKGQTDAVNKGFRMAHGSILGWINADDLYAAGAVNDAMSQFDLAPRLMLVYGDGDNLNGTGEVLSKYPTGPFRLEDLAYTCFICQPASFYRRELIEKVGYLDADLMCSMDLDLWIRMGFARRDHPEWEFRYVPRLWAHNRFHGGAKTFVLRKKHLQVTIDLVKKYFGFVPFNWVYALEETRDGRYDGVFRKRPLGARFILTSLWRWLLMNKSNPGHILRFGLKTLFSPFRALRTLKNRAVE